MAHRALALHEDVSIELPDQPDVLKGDLAEPEGAAALVLFAHGSGSSRFSRRNRAVAEMLNDAGLATLLFDLLTEQEELVDLRTMELRFDIDLLAQRLVAVIDWCATRADTRDLPIGLFGASTGAAAGLIAAVERPDAVRAVVSRGGRPDLAANALPHVQAPVLLIVGGDDRSVLVMNREAAAQLRVEHRIEIIRGATHLFEEPGALEQVAKHAESWLSRYCAALRDG